MVRMTSFAGPAREAVMTTTVGDIAALVRSKNAGPFWLTLDVFCDTDRAYDAVAAPGVITAERIADIYGADPDSVRIFRLPDLRVVKVSLPRPTIQGSIADRDMHAGQQHVPLARLALKAVASSRRRPRPSGR
jgi:hypothetical protein